MSETNDDQITDPNPRPQKVRDEHKDLLSSARYVLSERTPWIAKALFQCPVLDLPGAGYNATDSKGRIYVDFSAIAEDETLIEGRDTARLAAYLLIGLWRVLRDHDERGSIYATRDTEEHWSVASTAVSSRDAVRSVLADPSREAVHDDPTEGIDTRGLLPIPTHTPASLEQLLDLDFSRAHSLGRSLATVGVEDVYDALVHAAPPEEPDQQTGEPDQQSGGGEGGGSGDQASSGQDSDEQSGSEHSGTASDQDDQEQSGDGQNGPESEGQDGQGQGQQPGDPDGSAQGQGSGPGLPSDSAFRTMDPDDADAMDNVNGLSQSDKELMRHQVAKDIADANSSGIGNQLPESVQEWSADQLADPILSPHSLFQQRVGGKLDHARSGRAGTYRKRSRRQSGVGGRVVLKGRVQRVKDVYVGVDVSGSRSDAELTRDFAEIANLASDRSMRVKYFSVSTMPHGVRDLARGEEPVFDRDQAGTDMRVAFDLFDIHQAQARILMTDGYTPWPEEVEPGTQTLVAITAPSEHVYEQVASNVTPGIETVWLPPVEHDA